MLTSPIRGSGGTNQVSVPDYIARRVRTPYPDIHYVLRGSTPVISFGDFRTATVATLGLNPSDREFLKKGEWLTGPQQRLASLRSLGLAAPEDASDAQVQEIMNACCRYFNGSNPYWRWFRPLDSLLQEGLSVSYEEGSAVHLDLVQWATAPVWGKIKEPHFRQQLILNDREFLREQLARENIQLVVMNGRSVIREAERMGMRIDDRTHLLGGYPKDEVVHGRLDGTTFFGWNYHIQNRGFSKEQRAQVLAQMKGLGRD